MKNNDLGANIGATTEPNEVAAMHWATARGFDLAAPHWDDLTSEIRTALNRMTVNLGVLRNAASQQTQQRTRPTNARLAELLREAAKRIDAKAGGVRKGFSDLNFANNALRKAADDLTAEARAPMTDQQSAAPTAAQRRGVFLNTYAAAPLSRRELDEMTQRCIMPSDLHPTSDYDRLLATARAYIELTQP